MFITVEGPNGAGKSTFIELLYKKLKADYTVYCTKEPSDTDFGNKIRINEENIRGLEYAKMIAQDRKNHLQSFIIPKLMDFDIVICDRYVESSLVYQVFDGVPLECVWNMNKEFLIPDLSIVIFASPSEAKKRLDTRKSLTYFEKIMSRDDEIQYYKRAIDFLAQKRYNIIQIYNNEPEDIECNITRILRTIRVHTEL